MKYERRQSQDDVAKNTECYDGKGDICDNNIAAECKYNESGKEEEDGDEKEGRKCFDQLRDVEPVRAACKVLSDVCADMGWIIPLSKLAIPASPLLQHGSHEGAHETQHEADKPDRVHEHGGSGGTEGILGID